MSETVYRSGVVRSSEVCLAPDSPREAGTIEIGLVVPMRGPAGIFGLSCYMSAVLAAETLNETEGLLGREVRIRPIDGAGSPSQVAERVTAETDAGRVDAVAGWHLSHVRRAVVSRIQARVPYVYSALYEGGEHTPGVFITGETPSRQIRPALAWLATQLGVRRWALVGDDYLWPHGSAAAVRGHARELDLRITDEVFVPLGTGDFSSVVHGLQQSDAQGVLQLLVGQDAVHFNREFAAAGLDERMVRLSPLMDENMLLASGPQATRGLYSAAGFFEGLATPGALELVGRYSERFGPDAPVLNSMGESCFEAVQLLAALATRSRSLEVGAMFRAARQPIGYDGPRGTVHLQDDHLVQDVYLARAETTTFDVITRL
ncbi:hypothetical protein ER308_19890 [Egibacter rhizosphaerae]|uniref:Leucine-binding protein domain-containing protein n=1 Tax=Egibacter rhizosphaerae TaxID=1670831 RepID=A0A411YK70_9ACTN|nr:substrate-binding domain-containing protein [Egibacter rhizosphaerae]QBI21602.1 hypothetical protein ER308_19890 [Egibacter rhizosphaerae]